MALPTRRPTSVLLQLLLVSLALAAAFRFAEAARHARALTPAALDEDDAAVPVAVQHVVVVDKFGGAHAAGGGHGAGGHAGGGEGGHSASGSEEGGAGGGSDAAGARAAAGAVGASSGTRRRSAAAAGESERGAWRAAGAGAALAAALVVW